MILLFCNIIRYWVIKLEKDDEDQECNDNIGFVKSTVTADQQNYDWFEVFQEDWVVLQNGDDRWMPLEDFRT